MNREGHLGVALAAYAPIGFVTVTAGFRDLAFVGAGLVVCLAMLPDVDIRIPLMAHRGLTHTLWFALAVASACGGLGALAGRSGGPTVTTSLAAFGAAVGLVTICSHVAADALTPLGVRPLAPFGPRYSAGLVRSSNRIANVVLLVSGVGILVGAFALATRLG